MMGRAPSRDVRPIPEALPNPSGERNQHDESACCIRELGPRPRSRRSVDYWSRSPAAQASTSRPNRRSRVSGRFASLIQKARILR